MSLHKRKVAFISGAGRGIGLAIAKTLAGKGYDVATFSRHQDQLDQFVETMRSLGARGFALCGDGADVGFLEKFVNKAINEFGGVNVLVNNAGRYIRSAVEDMDIKKWDECLNINLRAPMVLSRLCIPHLRKHGSATIINIVSVAGRMSFPTASAYCASKHGLMALTECLFEEVREDGIKVTAICPGFVETEMVAGNDRVDPKRMVSPEDIADTVAYVLDLSPRACPVEITVRPQKTPYV